MANDHPPRFAMLSVGLNPSISGGSIRSLNGEREIGQQWREVRIRFGQRHGQFQGRRLGAPIDFDLALNRSTIQYSRTPGVSRRQLGLPVTLFIRGAWRRSQP
jgi:hypothetical protein